MNIWKSLPDYPTKEDIKYEISSYLYKDGKLDNGFSFSTLKTIYGKDWEETSHFNIIQDMIVSEEVEKLDKKAGGNDWYKIIDNN